MAKHAKPRDLAALRTRIAAARLKGADAALIERARKLLLVYLDTAQAHAVPFEALAKDLRTGLPALRIAGAELQRQDEDPAGPLATAACASGCAFCCILAGEDGGTITEAEARQLHAALVPLAGQPGASAWHPRACAALDPATRLCRAYEARPLICRTYVSRDASACEKIAQGTPASGPGVLGAQGLLLAAQALVRAALDGVTKVPTYSMARITAGAMRAEPLAETLRAARQPPRTLDDERRRLGG